VTQDTGAATSRSIGFRLVANLAWLVLAGIGVWWLRRDVDQLDDIQIQIGQTIAFTAVMMVVPAYLMTAGFEALFGAVTKRLPVRPEMLGERGPLSLLRWERSLSWLDRLFEIGFIALGVWTVGLLTAIDLFPGIMALVTLFVQVMFLGMGRLPGGRMMVGCGGLIAGVQLLLIGSTLLFVYTQTPEGGDLSIGAALAMIGPGVRMFAAAGFAVVAMVRQGWPPVGAE